MSVVDQRKLDEVAFHDQLRSVYERDTDRYAYYTSNKKYYSVVRTSLAYVESLLARECAGKRVLDFGCGDGRFSIQLARHAASVIGVDISPESVRICREEAIRAGVADKVSFEVGDCESLPFSDASFDAVLDMGVLHHMDVAKAFSEMSRVLEANGTVICGEALVHNPFIQLYRRRTPHLRTEWEMNHILGAREIALAKRHFRRIDYRFFHLAVLAAVPFRNTGLFEPLLTLLEWVDRAALRVPGLRWWAWQVVFQLREPIRSAAITGTSRGS